EEAAALGVRVARVRLLVVIAATVGTAAAVAVSGLIGFVGIIVPHTIRLLAGGSYRLLLPLTVLPGAGFLVLPDVVARTIVGRARRAAVVTPIPTMPPEMSLREYVLLGRTPYIGYLASERRHDLDAAAAAMARLDLGPLVRRRLHALSGGERQRVVLARALA